MDVKSTTLITLTVILLWFSWQPTGANKASASGDPTVSITKDQVATFDKAFTSLAQKAQVTIIAEDQPLKTSLGPDVALDIKQAGEPLSSLLPKVAAAYDYDVQRSGTVFLLLKRYSDPQDIPDVTLAECGLSMKDVNLIIHSFDPHLQRGAIENSPAIRDLLYSLTPEQIQAMADKQHGLSVASLSPDQQQAIRQLVLFLYVQLPIGNAQTSIDKIQRVSENEPQFCWRDLNSLQRSGSMRFASLPLFGFELPALATGTKEFTVLSKPDFIEMQGGAFVYKGTVVNGLLTLTNRPDPTDPPKAPTPRVPAPVVLSSSLGQLADQLNTRTHGAPKMIVDALLAPKRATVFGGEFATPTQVLSALADLYGLRVREEEKGQLRLTRKLFQIPLQMEGLYQAVQRVLPSPLLRAQQQQGFRRPSPLRVAAVRSLRTVIEPKLKTAKDGHVPLSALSDKENMVLATALMADTIGILNEALLRPVPPAVTQLTGLYLTGDVTVKDGHRTISLFLNTLNADGTGLVTGPGVGNMKYDP